MRRIVVCLITGLVVGPVLAGCMCPLLDPGRAGCAAAVPENTIIGGIVDAGQRVKLTQTASEDIALHNSFGCLRAGFTLQNSYYRVFSLADFGITSTLHITEVDFGIQEAVAGHGAGSQPATVKLGSYGARPGSTLDLAQIAPIRSADIQIPDGTATHMTVPIAADIPAGASVIAELAIPDGFTQNHLFLVGTNTDTEQAPGYTFAPEPDCMIDVPTSMQTIAEAKAFGTVHLVMTISGTLDSAAPES